MSDIDTAVVDGLKALDPKRPIREADVDQKQPEDDPKFKFGIPSCAGCFPTVSDRGLVTACLHERAKPDFDTKRFLWTVWKRFRVWRNPRVVLMVAANSVLATPFEE